MNADATKRHGGPISRKGVAGYDAPPFDLTAGLAVIAESCTRALSSGPQTPHESSKASEPVALSQRRLEAARSLVMARRSKELKHHQRLAGGGARMGVGAEHLCHESILEQSRSAYYVPKEEAVVDPAALVAKAKAGVDVSDATVADPPPIERRLVALKRKLCPSTAERTDHNTQHRSELSSGAADRRSCAPECKPALSAAQIAERRRLKAMGISRQTTASGKEKPRVLTMHTLLAESLISNTARSPSDVET